MSRQFATTYRPALVISTLVLTGMLLTQFTSLTSATNQADSRHFAQKVNLALRRTAHHLLAERGDSTSRIQPVQQVDGHTFAIRLERPFEYGRLPALLQESFAVHAINSNYDVAILDCATQELQLGYNFLDLTQKHEVPCGGRQQGRGCYTLQVAFTALPDAPQPTSVWWLVGLGGLMVSVFYGARHWSVRTQHIRKVESSLGNNVAPLQVGQFRFDFTNQLLLSDTSQQKLTYREAKLLHLFAVNPNRLLEREFILKSVWEDEGVFVGRSVDVFVSRLRKLIQEDPTLRIVAVHGVGYRLEVS